MKTAWCLTLFPVSCRNAPSSPILTTVTLPFLGWKTFISLSTVIKRLCYLCVFVVISLSFMRKPQHEKKALILPVIRSQREPVSPTLSGKLPHKVLTSGLLHSHSGPAAASGTGPNWVVLSSGHCLCQQGGEYLDPTTLQVWGCHWCIDMVKSHCGKSSALQGDFCWVPEPCPGGRQTLQTSHHCVWSGSSAHAGSAHCGFLDVCGQVHAEVNLSLVMAAVMEKHSYIKLSM